MSFPKNEKKGEKRNLYMDELFLIRSITIDRVIPFMPTLMFMWWGIQSQQITTGQLLQVLVSSVR